MRKTLISIIFFRLLFAAELKTPAEFLGYELGDYFTPHHKVVSYFEYVSNQEPNIRTCLLYTSDAADE